MEKKRSNEILLIGIYTVILGAWMSFRNIPFISVILDLPQLIKDIGLFASLMTVYSCLFYIAVLVGGISFLLLKKWGKILVFICLFIDMLTRLFGIFNYWNVSLAMGRLEIPKGYVIAGTYSMIPAYIIVITEIIVLYATTRFRVKKQFK